MKSGADFASVSRGGALLAEGSPRSLVMLSVSVSGERLRCTMFPHLFGRSGVDDTAGAPLLCDARACYRPKGYTLVFHYCPSSVAAQSILSHGAAYSFAEHVWLVFS